MPVSSVDVVDEVDEVVGNGSLVVVSVEVTEPDVATSLVVPLLTSTSVVVEDGLVHAPAKSSRRDLLVGTISQE